MSLQASLQDAEMCEDVKLTKTTVEAEKEPGPREGRGTWAKDSRTQGGGRGGNGGGGRPRSVQNPEECVREQGSWTP